MRHYPNGLDLRLPQYKPVLSTIFERPYAEDSKTQGPGMPKTFSHNTGKLYFDSPRMHALQTVLPFDVVDRINKYSDFKQKPYVYERKNFKNRPKHAYRYPTVFGLVDPTILTQWGRHLHEDARKSIAQKKQKDHCCVLRAYIPDVIKTTKKLNKRFK